MDSIKIFVVLLTFLVLSRGKITKQEKAQLKDKALEMFHHAYKSYMNHAYPADELMPLSCKGRYRGSEPSRGDVDDTLGNFTLTLVDSLDTLAVLGEYDLFEDAVSKLIRDASFDTDVVVSVFETNIRILGGLLGGHTMAGYIKAKKNRMMWYDGQLLKMAQDIADRLLPAFNTSTGIPYPRVNLRHGVRGKQSRTGVEKDTCTACAGTMILEFSALSRLTGNSLYEEKASKAMDYLWQSRHKTSDLMGVVININNGDWVRKESGVGAGIDSYYEYLLKAYIMLGDDTYLDRFNTHYKAIMKYINNGPLMLDVHMHKPMTNSRNFMDALLAFWPGLQVMKGDLKPAIELHEMLYQVMQRHNFIPEAFTSDFRVHWAQHPLRPEFLESTYFLYKATNDDYYLEVGRDVMEKMDKMTRTKCGFAGVKDVTTGLLEDQMDSFVLAETFKYLYLLFTEKEDLQVDVDDFIFTTEAHLLPLFISHPFNVSHDHEDEIKKMSASKISLNEEEEEEEEDEDTCPSRMQTDYAREVRDPLKNMVLKLCPKTERSRLSRLRASDFVAGDEKQVDRLAMMGIRLVTKEDGRVQLVHVASQARSSEDSHEGMLFMQEMIELSKAHNDKVLEPRIVQLLSPPNFGKVVFEAGPAQFGTILNNKKAVEGVAILSWPKDACTDILNDVKGKIVLVERGNCMFIEKARKVQEAGGIGVVVTDTTEGSNSVEGQFFSMSGDGKDDISMPAVFLFHVDAMRLLSVLHTHPPLVLRLASAPKQTETILIHHLLAKNIYKEVDNVIEKSKINGKDNEKIEENSSSKLEDGEKIEGVGKLGYHHVKVKRTMMMTLEYLGFGNLINVLHNEADSVGNERDVEGGISRLRLTEVASKPLCSLIKDQFPVRVIRQLVSAPPPITYSADDEEEDVDKISLTVEDGDIRIIEKIHRESEEQNGATKIKPNVLRFVRSSSNNLQGDVALVLTHVVTILHHCTNIASLHLDASLDFKESMEALARLVEYTFTEGKMMFAVNNEVQLGKINVAVKIKDSCSHFAGYNRDAGKLEDSTTENDALKIEKNKTPSKESTKEEDEVISSLADQLHVGADVIKASLEQYVEKEVGKLFEDVFVEGVGGGRKVGVGEGVVERKGNTGNVDMKKESGDGEEDTGTSKKEAINTGNSEFVWKQMEESKQQLDSNDFFVPSNQQEQETEQQQHNKDDL